MKLCCATVRRIWGAPWKAWFPIQTALPNEVQFGESGRVVFEFEERRVIFRKGESAVEIARLHPDEVKDGAIYDFHGRMAGGKVESIHDFYGRIIGESFEVTVHPPGGFGVFGEASMSVSCARTGRVQAAGLQSLVLRDESFHQRFRFRHSSDKEGKFLEVSYAPGDENVCRIVSAVLVSHIDSISVS
jgi:hypothetical protein